MKCNNLNSLGGGSNSKKRKNGGFTASASKASSQMSSSHKSQIISNGKLGTKYSDLYVSPHSLNDGESLYSKLDLLTSPSFPNHYSLINGTSSYDTNTNVTEYYYYPKNNSNYRQNRPHASDYPVSSSCFLPH